MWGGAFCCYWRQTGIPDKCENVSKLGREAGEVLEVKFGLLGHHYSYCVAVTSSKNRRYIFDDPVNDFHSFFFLSVIGSVLLFRFKNFQVGI